MKMWLLLSSIFLMCFQCPLQAFHFIITPGIGGSILYDENSKKIWPPNLIPINPKSFRHPNDILRTTGRIGDPKSIRIDTGSIYAFTKNTYYAGLIDYLSQDNLVSAFPYDFRYIHLPDYYMHLFTGYKNYIEKHHQLTGEKSIIVAHSMGGLVMQHFLNTFLTKSWASRHIDRIYFVNTPFGGSSSALFLLADNLLQQNTQQSHLTRLVSSLPNLRSFGGFYVCIPTTNGPYLRWGGSTYSHKNLDELFQHDPTMGWMLEMARPFHKSAVRAPPIPHVVVHSYGKNTCFFKDYDLGVSRDTDGDGLVTTASLLHMPRNGNTIRVAVPHEEHSNINNNMIVQSMIARNGVSLHPEDEPVTTNNNQILSLPNWLFMR